MCMLTPIFLQQSTTAAAEANAAAAALLPAYCDPPNPCPPGYTERDGCIEDFENSSEFSRIYQVNLSTSLNLLILELHCKFYKLNFKKNLIRPKSYICCCY